MDQSACCTRKSSRGMANRCGTIFLLHKALHDPLCTSFTRPTFTCKTSKNYGIQYQVWKSHMWWNTVPGVEIAHVVSVSCASPRSQLGRRGLRVEIWGAPTGLGRRGLRVESRYGTVKGKAVNKCEISVRVRTIQ